MGLLERLRETDRVVMNDAIGVLYSLLVPFSSVTDGLSKCLVTRADISCGVATKCQLVLDSVWVLIPSDDPK